jgi:hypothetical protein
MTEKMRFGPANPHPLSELTEKFDQSVANFAGHNFRTRMRRSSGSAQKITATTGQIREAFPNK